MNCIMTECRVFVFVVDQPRVYVQVCHSSLLGTIFAGAEDESKTKAKGKENSGRKVTKRPRGKENATDSSKTKKSKTKGKQWSSAITQIQAQKHDRSCMYKSSNSFF